MPDTALIQNDLIALLRDWTVERKPIGPETAIYHDLYLAGDDAYEILREIVKRYDTAFDGLNFGTYFAPEYAMPWRLWAAKLGYPDSKRPRLTVAHMVRVIERGRWFPP
jgi:hypothetical protein